MVKRVDLYYDAMVARYLKYLDDVFFPDGEPLFTEVLDERMEFLKLQEAKSKAEAGMQDPEAAFWNENKDGAQERYMALEEQFRQELSHAGR